MAFNLSARINVLKRVPAMSQQFAYYGSGDLGSGAGKGGGSGGSIRDAGGSFGKMEAAREEEYFRKLQAKQLEDLKKKMNTEIEYHENQIKRHADAIQDVKNTLKSNEN